MEFYKTDLLQYYLSFERNFSEKEAALFFYKICKAVEELHENGIAHLDLKLENILLTNDNEVRLCDFGSATRFSANETMPVIKKIGTPFYLAPELLGSGDFLPDRADSWSLGVILHVLLVKCLPVYDPSQRSTPFNFTLQHMNNYGVSSKAENLVRNLLCFEPSNRLSIDQILQHPWLVTNLREETPKKNLRTSGLKRLKRAVQAQTATRKAV